MDTRKRKRVTTLISPSSNTCIKALILCFSFFPFLLFLSHHIHIQEVGLVGFRNPTRLASTTLPQLRVQLRVLFPYCVLVIVGVNKEVNDRHRYRNEDIECLYHRQLNESDADRRVNKEFDVRPALSVDGYDEFRWIVRCPVPAGNYSAVVGLRWQRADVAEGVDSDGGVDKWDMVTYEAVMDGEESVVLFVKGLNLRPDRESDPNQFTCRFRWGTMDQRESEVHTSKAITAAQEVVRCALPEDVRTNIRKVERVEVTISMRTRIHGRGRELCACTMVWNQASAIREWIMYHAWLGVERWFVYDNNSDDDIVL